MSLQDAHLLATWEHHTPCCQILAHLPPLPKSITTSWLSKPSPLSLSPLFTSIATALVAGSNTSTASKINGLGLGYEPESPGVLRTLVPLARHGEGAVFWPGGAGQQVSSRLGLQAQFYLATSFPEVRAAKPTSPASQLEAPGHVSSQWNPGCQAGHGFSVRHCPHRALQG